MFEKVNGIELTQEEIDFCRQAFEAVIASEDGARKLIEENFEDGEAVFSQIERGVTEFHALMEADMRSENAIRDKLNDMMADKTRVQQLRCLLDMLVSLSASCSKMYGCDAWNDRIEEYKALLEAAEGGEADAQLERIADAIPELMEQVCEHINQTSVLLAGLSEHEYTIRDLEETAKETGEDEVQTVLANSPQANIAAASVLYTAYATGKLPSLGGDMEYTPYTMGVCAACALETDAAIKSGNWEEMEPRITSAARAAVTLLIGILAVTGIVMAFTYGAQAFAALIKFSGTKQLARLIGIMAGLNVASELSPMIDDFSNKVYDAGLKVVTVSASAVRNGYNRLQDWIHNTVLPAAWALWNKCSNFFHGRVHGHAAGPLEKNAAGNAYVIKTSEHLPETVSVMDAETGKIEHIPVAWE